MKRRVNRLKGIFALLVMLLTLTGAMPALAVIVDVQDSIIPILSVDIQRQEQAVIGQEFTIVYNIKNISNKPAFNLVFGFTVEGDYNPFTATAPEAIKQLDSGASATMTVKYKVAADAREKTFRMTSTVSCQDALMGQGANPSYSTITDVKVTFDPVIPDLLITDIKVLEQKPDIDNGFTARIFLKNNSLIYDLRSVNLQLDGGDNFEVLNVSNKTELKVISANQSAYVDYKLRAKDTRKGNIVKLTSYFNYDNGSTKEKPAEETLNLPLSTNVAGNNGKIPRVIIKKYTLSADKVLAGDKIDLTVSIENTNTRPVKNVLVNFGVQSITSSSGGGTTTSTVFSPVNSSNTFHMDKIEGQTMVNRTITFNVDSGATAMTYVVPVTITYEDENGTAVTPVEDTVNIPVTQESKLTVISTTFPNTANVGMPTPVQAEFVNSGKVDIADFTVNLEGDFETMDASSYQAKLTIGTTNSYAGMIVPSEEGTKEGKLVVSYTDNNNETVTQEFPFTVEVTQMEEVDPGIIDGNDPNGMDPGMADGQGSGAGAFLKAHWLTIGLVLVVAGMFIYIVRLKKKSKEEFFDEDR
ncbi:MAG: hypothetical protein VB085_06825 [Peptococcaceae bacterium]|nr:hypothetical protein [Peptococcaceae bacterium]